MKQPRPTLALALLFAFICGGALAANAQPPDGGFDDGPLFDDGPRGGRPPGGGFDGPGGPGGPGGRRPPRGGKGRLEGTVHGVQRLQSNDKSLSKSQAAKLVSLIKPWSTKAQMSDSEAQKLAQSLEAVLTSTQKSKIGPPGRGGRPRGGDGDFSLPPPPDGEGGPGGPPPGGDFGPPPGDDFGPPPGDDGPRDGRGPDSPKRRVPPPANFNPFYPPTGRSDWKKFPTAYQQMLARRYRESRAVLESLSRFAKS